MEREGGLRLGLYLKNTVAEDDCEKLSASCVCVCVRAQACVRACVRACNSERRPVVRKLCVGRQMAAGAREGGGEEGKGRRGEVARTRERERERVRGRK